MRDYNLGVEINLFLFKLLLIMEYHRNAKGSRTEIVTRSGILLRHDHVGFAEDSGNIQNLGLENC